MKNLNIDENTRLKFGKYRDKRITDVPARYLLYVYENHKKNGLNRDVFEYVQDNYEMLKTQSRCETPDFTKSPPKVKPKERRIDKARPNITDKDDYFNNLTY